MSQTPDASPAPGHATPDSPPPRPEDVFDPDDTEEEDRTDAADHMAASSDAEPVDEGGPSDAGLSIEMENEKTRRTALKPNDRLRLGAAAALTAVAISGLVYAGWFGFSKFTMQLEALQGMGPRLVGKPAMWSAPPPHPHPELFSWLFLAKGFFTATVMGFSLAVLQQARHLFRPLWLPERRRAKKKRAEPVVTEKAIMASIAAALVAALTKSKS